MSEQIDTGREENPLIPLLQALLADPGKAGYYLGMLEPLRQYDREHNGDLVKTLAAYLEQGGNSNRAAAALFLHRNSLRYRLARVQALLGLDPDDPGTRLALQVAVMLEDEGRKTRDEGTSGKTKDQG